MPNFLVEMLISVDFWLSFRISVLHSWKSIILIFELSHYLSSLCIVDYRTYFACRDTIFGLRGLFSYPEPVHSCALPRNIIT